MITLPEQNSFYDPNDPHWDMTIPARRSWGRAVLIDAYAMVFPGETPTLAVLQILQGQTEGEGWYGYAGKPPEWKGSKNWGGVQCSMTPPCDESLCFPAGDKHGDGTEYGACFKRYDTDEDGAANFIQNALIYHHGSIAKPAALAGDVLAYCRALRTPPVYFEGISTDLETAAQAYAQGIFNRVQGIASDLGEPVAISLDGASNGGPSAGGILIGALALFCAYKAFA